METQARFECNVTNSRRGNVKIQCAEKNLVLVLPERSHPSDFAALSSAT